MKIIALRAVEVTGHGIVNRGQMIDLAEDMIDGRIAANFKKEDGGQLAASATKSVAREKTAAPSAEEKEKAAIDRAVKVIGRDGIMRKLDDLGITYKPTHKSEYLAKLMLTAQGEI